MTAGQILILQQGNKSNMTEQEYIIKKNDGRPKMTVADRAKQFAPFAALTGLGKALAQKEKIVVPRPILTDESLEELDRQMKEIKKGSLAQVIYYSHGECIKISGMVAKIEETSRIIQIVNKRISFDDILDIRPCE